MVYEIDKKNCPQFILNIDIERYAINLFTPTAFYNTLYWGHVNMFYQARSNRTKNNYLKKVSQLSFQQNCTANLKQSGFDFYMF